MHKIVLFWGQMGSLLPLEAPGLTLTEGFGNGCLRHIISISELTTGIEPHIQQQNTDAEN